MHFALVNLGIIFIVSIYCDYGIRGCFWLALVGLLQRFEKSVEQLAAGIGCSAVESSRLRHSSPLGYLG